MPFPSQPMYTLIKTTTLLIFPPWKNFACPWTSYWLNYIVCTLLAMVSFNLYEMFYVLSSFNSLLSSSIQLTNHHWDYKHSIDRKMGCFQFWVLWTYLFMYFCGICLAFGDMSHHLLGTQESDGKLAHGHTHILADPENFLTARVWELLWSYPCPRSGGSQVCRAF